MTNNTMKKRSRNSTCRVQDSEATQPTPNLRSNRRFCFRKETTYGTATISKTVQNFCVVAALLCVGCTNAIIGPGSAVRLREVTYTHGEYSATLGKIEKRHDIEAIVLGRGDKSGVWWHQWRCAVRAPGRTRSIEFSLEDNMTEITATMTESEYDEMVKDCCEAVSARRSGAGVQQVITASKQYLVFAGMTQAEIGNRLGLARQRQQADLKAATKLDQERAQRRTDRDREIWTQEELHKIIANATREVDDNIRKLSNLNEFNAQLEAWGLAKKSPSFFMTVIKPDKPRGRKKIAQREAFRKDVIAARVRSKTPPGFRA